MAKGAPIRSADHEQHLAGHGASGAQRSNTPIGPASLIAKRNRDPDNRAQDASLTDGPMGCGFVARGLADTRFA
jgi:hypothetical protein